MIIDNKIKVKIKQKKSQSVNAINIRADHLTKDEKRKLDGVISEHRTLFNEPNEKLTFTTAVVADIQTKTDDPVYSRYYPYPMHLKGEVEQQIKELLEQGIIRPSRSPYNSPIWIVPKKLTPQEKRNFAWL